MPFFSKTQAIGDAGAGLVAMKVRHEMKWIYREQPSSDLGIDGEIEIGTPGEISTGILIKVQIKSSERFKLNEKISIPIERRHLSYWQNLRLPVILLLVDIKLGTVYWLPITSEMQIPEGQESMSFSIDRTDELVKNKTIIHEWARSAPFSAVEGLLQLAVSESENYSRYSFAIDNLELTEGENVARELIGMVRKLEDLVDGLMTDNELDRIIEAEKKVFAPRIKAIADSLAACSDETADGQVDANCEYDKNLNEWTLSFSGSISLGNDESSDNNGPKWDDVSFKECSHDLVELIFKAQKDLSEIKNDWDHQKKIRDGYIPPDPDRFD